MQYLNFHTHHRPNTKEVLAITNESLNSFNHNETSYTSVGIHPWETLDFKPEQLESLQALTSHDSVLAIGECGLDKLKGAELETQTTIFKEHIRISEEVRKPIIIHCVKAYSEIIKLRKELTPEQHWVFHGFNSSIETMQQALSAGIYISFGPTILKPNTKAHQAFLNCPLDRLFIETDDTVLDIKEIYQYAAQARQIDLSFLCQQTTHNLNRIIKQYISI